MKNTYIELIDKHKGKSCVILGAGPSLYDLCIYKRFKEILNYVVISVNSSFMPLSKFNLDPEKHYWMSCDSLTMRWNYWKDVKKSNCTKIVRNSWLKYKGELDNFLYFETRPTSEDVVNPDDTGLCYCSSIPASIDLAISFGCKKIILFGVDHNNINRRYHFWQLLYNKENRPTANANIYDSWEKQNKVFEFNQKAYKALRKFADFKKVEIYNCSNITKVTAFDRVSMDYAFKILGE